MIRVRIVADAHGRRLKGDVVSYDNASAEHLIEVGIAELVKQWPPAPVVSDESGAGTPPPVVELFDPASHNVDEVQAHLVDPATSPEERARVLALEHAGKDRQAFRVS